MIMKNDDYDYGKINKSLNEFELRLTIRDYVIHKLVYTKCELRLTIRNYKICNARVSVGKSK